MLLPKASRVVSAGTAPSVGFSPTSPLHEAGPRIEPAPSVPSDSGPSPAATAAAPPPLEPPGVRSRFQGLRVMPKDGPSVSPFTPNSGVVALAMMMAPAARRRLTRMSSAAAGGLSSKIAEPCRVGTPFTSTRSLTLIGTPCSGPSGSPLLTAASAALASRRACSSMTTRKQLSLGWPCRRPSARHRHTRQAKAFWRG